MSTTVLSTIGSIDDVLASIYKREEICSELDKYFSNNIPVLDKAIEMLLTIPKKEMRNIIERTNKLRSHTIEKLFLLDKKHNIHCNLDAIDYNLFLNKLENIIQIAETIKKNREMEFEIYKYLTVKQKILSYYLLKSNWDSYGAKPISDRAIKSSAKFIDMINSKKIKTYFVAPSPFEGVTVELKEKDKKIKIEFDSNGRANYFLFNKNKFIEKGYAKIIDENILMFLN